MKLASIFGLLVFVSRNGDFASALVFPPFIGRCSNPTRAPPSLAMSNNGFFDKIRNFFDPSENNGGNESDDATDEERAAGSTNLITLPVQALKPGGLRLFLMFYLLGMQNTPEKNSWQADQPSSDAYVVDFFYQDRTALLSIELLDDKITIDRVGSEPSTAYLMQESVVIEGLLNELDQCAFDSSVAEGDRLLLLKEPQDAIEKARDTLAFS